MVLVILIGFWWMGGTDVMDIKLTFMRRFSAPTANDHNKIKCSLVIFV